MIGDIFVPHMRGFKSVRIFHARMPAISLIAMSGRAFANLDSPAPDFLRMARERGTVRCPRMWFTPMALPMSSMRVSPKSVRASQALSGRASQQASYRRLRADVVTRACGMRRLGSVYHKPSCRFFLM
jgi:hypothetical protein